MRSLDRRAFCRGAARGTLGVLAAGAAGSLAACAAAVRPASATPVGSGAAGGGAIGVQLYTVRDAMRADPDAALARLAAIGYREVEFAGYHDRAPRALRATLDRVGLTAPSAHVPLEDVAPARLGAALEAAGTMGHRWLVVPWLAPAQRAADADGWRRLADRLTAAGRTAAAAGVRLAYHNHDFELRPLADGTRPLDVLLAATDPSLVDFELDVYWATFAGQDPVAWLDRHPGRIRLLHLKDSGGAPDHAMLSVGAGRIDFPRLLAAGARAGVRHAFVEHDAPSDAFASVTASHAYLAGLARAGR